MATAARRPSPLLRALLAVVDGGGGASEFEERLAGLGLTPRPGLVDELVAEASALGLVRVASVGAAGPRHVLTSLGGRLAADVGLSDEDFERLRDLESLRTELSATIAHEMRTPLTAIRTCATLLLSEEAHPTREQRHTLVETIERNAERMQRVVGDILDISRFRAGSITLQARRFDAGDLASSAIASIEPLAAQRSIQLAYDPPEHHIAVYGDRRRLEQALVNLISNAVRFSPDGGRVGIRVAATDGWVRWSVHDDGPGIAEADQKLLFERFFVGRSDRGGPRDGVGLGLPTALAIAGAHGGRIDVDSRIGSGSSFTLTTPIDGPADTATRDGLD
ncbi:MAG: sensor histidine kinase [Candidatus Limnocylindrales bacterium]